MRNLLITCVLQKSVLIIIFKFYKVKLRTENLQIQKTIERVV